MEKGNLEVVGRYKIIIEGSGSLGEKEEGKIGLEQKGLTAIYIIEDYTDVDDKMNIERMREMCVVYITNGQGV
jgi:hypothetical protein